MESQLKLFKKTETKTKVELKVNVSSSGSAGTVITMDQNTEAFPFMFTSTG